VHAPLLTARHFEQKKLHDPDITTYPCAASSKDTGSAAFVSVAVNNTVPSASSTNNPIIEIIFVFICSPLHLTVYTIYGSSIDLVINLTGILGYFLE
jgi:hypothetical protein